jgi:hypothetical protein
MVYMIGRRMSGQPSCSQTKHRQHRHAVAHQWDYISWSDGEALVTCSCHETVCMIDSATAVSLSSNQQGCVWLLHTRWLAGADVVRALTHSSAADVHAAEQHTCGRMEFLVPSALPVPALTSLLS